jgi:hypothetical protein
MARRYFLESQALPGLSVCNRFRESANQESASGGAIMRSSRSITFVARNAATGNFLTAHAAIAGT